MTEEQSLEMEIVRKEVDAFEAVAWSSCGCGAAREGSMGWVKFALQKSELGWRTLEFLAWVCDDMVRAGERLSFFPVAPPPYLNEPGNCLAFVIEVDSDEDAPQRFAKVAEFVNYCRTTYWPECKK